MKIEANVRRDGPGTAAVRLFPIILFASDAAAETRAPEAAAGGFPLYTAPIALPDGTTLQRQWLSLGGGDGVDVHHAPGHSPCSIAIRLGPVLLLGDLPFAVTPGVCGLDGWNHADLVKTVDVAVGCPAHGRCPQLSPPERVRARSSRRRWIRRGSAP